MTILIVGCGRMGGSLARRWIVNERVIIYDPVDPGIPGAQHFLTLSVPPEILGPTVIVLAVKPQIAGEILPALKPLTANGALTISVAAGISLASLQLALGAGAPVIRAMPNIPAAVGRGITALIAGSHVTERQKKQAEELLAVVGEVMWLEHERQMEAVTAVSGSGPAYFYRFTEALAKAGVAAGLPADLAIKLARGTLIGAGALASDVNDPIDTLREQVTSAGGTTAAALREFDKNDALDRMVSEAVAAAAHRSRQLGSLA